MATYRLKEFRSDGSERGWRDLTCADDVAAVEGADKLHAGYAMELWEGDRLVNSFPADRSRRRGPYWDGGAL